MKLRVEGCGGSTAPKHLKQTRYDLGRKSALPAHLRWRQQPILVCIERQVLLENLRKRLGAEPVVCSDLKRERRLGIAVKRNLEAF
jgi:hypothetical protein